MGNWFSLERTKDDIIEDISWSDKFSKYQDNFDEANPPRYLYIDDYDLVIETKSENPYAIDRISPDWSRSDIEDYIYTYLDSVYPVVVNNIVNNIVNNTVNNIVNNTVNNIENNTEEITEEDLSDYFTNESLIDFINESVSGNISDWNKWLDRFFYEKSLGYQIFKRMTDDDPDGTFLMVWYNILKQNVTNGIQLIETEREAVLSSYPYEQIPIEICDENEKCIVIVAKINNEWKYVGITTDWYCYCS